MLLKETTTLATGSQDNECPTVGVTAEDAVSLARGIGKYKALEDEAASLRRQGQDDLSDALEDEARRVLGECVGMACGICAIDDAHPAVEIEPPCFPEDVVSKAEELGIRFSVRNGRVVLGDRVFDVSFRVEVPYVDGRGLECWAIADFVAESEIFDGDPVCDLSRAVSVATCASAFDLMGRWVSPLTSRVRKDGFAGRVAPDSMPLYDARRIACKAFCAMDDFSDWLDRRYAAGPSCDSVGGDDAPDIAGDDDGRGAQPSRRG